jgi:hypothetical protein
MDILKFSRLAGDAALRHGISTRSKNVSFSAGEAYGDPVEGRRLLLEAAGIDPARTHVAGQVHGCRVARVTPDGAAALVRGRVVEATDALVTNVPGTGLLMTAADCPPVLLWDREARVLGAVHSGWRGTAQGIVMKAMDEMIRAGARARDVIAAVGPGIGVCCYEVGEEVAEAVPASWRDAVLRREGDRTKLDLRSWIRLQLEECGISDANRTDLDLCTSCRVDLFFSHRRENGQCGRFGLAAAFT